MIKSILVIMLGLGVNPQEEAEFPSEDEEGMLSGSENEDDTSDGQHLNVERVAIVRTNPPPPQSECGYEVNLNVTPEQLQFAEECAVLKASPAFKSYVQMVVSDVLWGNEDNPHQG